MLKELRPSGVLGDGPVSPLSAESSEWGWCSPKSSAVTALYSAWCSRGGCSLLLLVHGTKANAYPVWPPEVPMFPHTAQCRQLEEPRVGAENP